MNQLIQINAVYWDDQGLYIPADELKAIKSLYWTCKNNHVNYHTDYPTCVFCGAGPK